jgi:hypothetical protein
MKKLRVIVAGGRDFTDEKLLNKTLDGLFSGNTDMEVVCGEATGADTLGKKWAQRNNIEVKSFPADWKKHGKAAGPIRNVEMAKYATHLVAFWDGKSRGTLNMIEIADGRGLSTVIVRY